MDTNWIKVKEGVGAWNAWEGHMRFRSSAPGLLMIDMPDGQEDYFAGRGDEFTLKIQGPFRWFFDAPVGTSVWVYRSPSTSFQAEGEVFTNIDRMPGEGGPIAEVTRALRQLELEKRRMLVEIRAERDALLAAHQPYDPETGEVNPPPADPPPADQVVGN